jgi:hypothetical protein
MLYILHVGGALAGILIQQAVEAVRIALKLWGKDEGESVATEIVEAILTDQPVKMRSLSSMFHLDIASVDSMWVINGSTFSSEDVHRVTAEAHKFCQTVCADLYKESIVLFTDNIKKKVDVDALRTNIESVLGKDIRISYFTNLKDTGEVRSAYLLNYDSWRDASKIMPDEEFFVRGDIEFASECRRIVEGGVEIEPTAIIQQGYLETSNINAVSEMVEMITITRAYESNQKALQTADTMIEKAVNEVGRLG